MEEPEEISLGIDLGTTSVKVCLINKGDKSIIRTVSMETKADLASDVNGGSEQDTIKIITTVVQCLKEIPEAIREKISCIGVTGQMHGVVLWSDVNKGGNFNEIIF